MSEAKPDDYVYTAIDEISYGNKCNGLIVLGNLKLTRMC